MYLHLGNEKVVPHSEIIGLFDLDTTTVSKITRDFLARAEKEGRVVNVSYELPKSFVVCGNPLADKTTSRAGIPLSLRRHPPLTRGTGESVTKVFISQISTATLLRRAKIK